MKLQSLQLYDFRSYETASVSFHPGVNLIVGENAQGKTNLLESVFYLSTGKSFRTARNQELIRFGAEFADLSCTLFSGGREQSLRAVLFSGRRPRQLYIGGVKQRSAAGLSGVLTTVLFCPDDLLILKSGSSGRRKILDTALCQLRPGYAQALAEYQKLYDSKSRILKDYHDAPSLLETLQELNERFCLIYSGQRRLARNLLRDIVSRYVSGNPDTVEVLYEIQRIAVLMRFELEKGNVDGFAQLLNQHWELSRRLDGGCTNTCIDMIFSSVEDLIDGKMICGAGGGGFLQVILKKGVTVEQVQKRLREVFQDSGVEVWRCSLV